MSNIPTTGTLSFIIQMPETAGGEAGGGTGEPGSPRQESNQSGNPVGGDKNNQVKLATAVQAVKSVGMQAVNAVVSNIGLATGNYYAQRKVERAMQGAGQMVALAVSAANPVTFAVTLASMGVSSIAETWQQNKEREIENYQAAQYAKRLGYSRSRR